LAAAFAALFNLGSGPAWGQATWNLYDQYTTTIPIPFISAMGPAAGAYGEVYLNMSTVGSRPFVMDTGSVGIAATPENFTPKAGDIALGPGSITYSSSGIVENGTYYLTKVGIQTGAGANTVAATALVKVLQVTNITCLPNDGNPNYRCTPNNNPTGVNFMGVGFDRATTQSDSNVSNANPFTNIISLASGAPVSTMRTGYMITNTGVTLGISTAGTQNSAIMKLTPNTTNASELWNAAPVTLVTTASSGGSTVTTTGTGTFLPDSGIWYAYLAQAGNTALTPHTNAANGTIVGIYLPGQTTPQPAQFSFTVGAAGNPIAPDYVTVTASDTPFINTGRNFFQGFNYFYDQEGGYVGYEYVGTDPTLGSSLVGLSLTGSVALPNNFASSLPTYLSGGTTLVQTGVGTITGDIGGSGGLTKAGTGTLTLAGANTFTGGTTVAAGTLALTGSMTGDVTINSAGNFANNGTQTGAITNGGRLSGTGTTTGTVTNAGTWAPGNSIGTQNVVGAITFNPGSTYEAEVNAAGASDKIAVTGTANLLGGTVRVLPAQGTYPVSQSYTILTATGGVTGTFTNATSSLPFLTPSLSYTATDVTLALTRGPNAFASIATTGNQRAIGNTLDRAAANGQMPNIINALTVLTLPEAESAYAQMSGETYSNVGSIGIFAGQTFMGTLNQQITAARAGGATALSSGNRVNLASLGQPVFGASESGASAGSPMRAGPWNTWMSGVGVTGSVAGSDGSQTLNYSGGGAAMGVDRNFGPDVIAGLAFGYAATNVSTQGVSSSGTVNSYQGALYASYNPSALYVQGLAGYAYNENETTRTISFPGVNSTAQGSTYSNQFIGALETGYAFPIATKMNLTPLVGLQTAVANQASFTETGAGALDLTVDSQTTTSVRSILGFQIDHDADVGLGSPLSLIARAGWAHEYANTARPMTASFAGSPGAGFTVNGAQLARDSAVIAAGASVKMTENLSFLLRYDGDVNGADYAHAVTGRLSLTW